MNDFTVIETIIIYIIFSVTDLAKRDSPSQNKRALALVRRSFYSTGPMNRSRNLTKSFQLADRIAGRQRHISGNKSLGSLSQSLLSQFKSPDKNSSFLLSQLIGSPTPPKSTPRKNHCTPLKVAESPTVSMPESPGFSLLRSKESLALNTRSKMENLLDGNKDKEYSGKGTRTPRKLELSVSKNLFLSPDQSSRSKLSSTPKRNSIHQKIDNRTPSKTQSVSKNLFLSPSQNTRSKVMSTPTRSSLPNIMDTLPSDNENNTPSKDESSVSKNLFLSPSQNTRSKVNSTPTRSSVRAILFMKSPELKMPLQSPEDISTATYFDQKNSPLINKFNNISDLEAKFSTNKRLTPSLSENESLIKCSYVDEDGSVKRILVKGDKMPNQVSKSMSVDLNNKTPSPRKRVKLDFGSPSSQNNSPSRTQVKTPTSLNHWPRKKHIYIGNANDLKVGNVSGSVNNTGDTSRVSGEIDISKISSKKHYNSEKNEDTMEQLGASDSGIGQTRILSRKRSLALSPDSVSSPSKRKRSTHLKQIVVNEEQKHLPLSYCLHSRIMSRQSSVFSDTEFSSQGFDTSQFHSSQTSMDSLGISTSQKSTGSADYFSLSNDEVFLSQSSDQNQKGKIPIQTVPSSPSTGRSESPVFGSGRKIKKRPTARISMGQAFETESEDVEMVSMETNSNTSEYREASNQTQKISPSGRKYSPNVSAKSLIHLMNSPLLKSPICGGEKVGRTDGNSPRIDQDSLNVRRKKMQGKSSRRSLKLQN